MPGKRGTKRSPSVSGSQQSKKSGSPRSQLKIPEKLITEEDSFRYMKKLLGLGLSTILYERRILDDSAYKIKYIGSLKVRVISDESKCKGVAPMITHMRAIFEAIEKQYLSTVIFTFYTDPKQADNVIEAYAFKFKYNEGSEPNGVTFTGSHTKPGSTTILPEVNTNKEETLESAAQKLIDSIKQLTLSIDPLPEPGPIFFQARLYYNENTPKDFEPEGFMNAEFPELSYPENTSTYKAGTVETKFHQLGVAIKAQFE